MKILLYVAIITLLFSAASYSQQDTSYKILKIRGTEVEIGKFYRIILTNGYLHDAKLKGITNKEILVIIENEAMEFNIAEIEKVIPLKFFNIPENSSGYNVSKRNSSPMIYFSLGYAKRLDANKEWAYSPSESYEGFSVQAGLLFKFNKYIGSIFDLSFLHLNGTSSESELGTPVQNYYYHWVNNYGDANDFLIRSGLALGYLDNDSRLNVYASFGIIFGFEARGADYFKEYTFENNTYNLFAASNAEATEFRIGGFGSLKLNFMISDNLLLLTEISFNAVKKKTGVYSNYSCGIGYQF